MDSKKQLNAAQITFRNAAEMLKGARDGIKGKKFLKSSVITFLCSEVVNDTKNSLSTLSGISGNTINRFDELAVGLAEYGAKAAIETLRLEDGEGSDAKAKASQILLIPFLEACSDFLGNMPQVASQQKNANGKPKTKKQKKRGRKLTPNEVANNKKINELIVEIRRRGEERYTLGLKGITKAYEEIERESLSAGSKWFKILPLKEKDIVIGKAVKNERYKEIM